MSERIEASLQTTEAGEVEGYANTGGIQAPPPPYRKPSPKGPNGELIGQFATGGPGLPSTPKWTGTPAIAGFNGLARFYTTGDGLLLH